MPEDWFNCVVPALMAFRAMILHDPALSVGKFSLDVQTSTGHDSANATNPGNPIAPAQMAQFAQPSNPAFGAQNLENWINAATNQFPYP